MTVDLCVAYIILMLASMTLTLTLNTFERLVFLVCNSGSGRMSDGPSELLIVDIITEM